MVDLKAYVDPRLDQEKIDDYYIRLSILNALKASLPALKGKFLDVGCGYMPYKDLIMSGSAVNEYTGLDLGDNVYGDRIPPDVTWDGVKMPFEDGTYDSAMATEVLEHCPDPQMVIDEIYRVLSPGGSFFFTVPFLWPLHDMPYDEYRYTPFALQRMFEKAGFSSIDIKPLGGWDASMAQMIALYVNRRPFGKSKRKLLRRLAKPVVKYLIRKDVKPDPMTGPMITGSSGVIIK